MNRPCLVLVAVVLVTSLFAPVRAAAGVDDTGPTPAKGGAGAANPSAVYCVELGYSSFDGNCVFPDGTQCPTWHFYRGKCGEKWSLCAKRGGRIENRIEKRGSWTAEFAVCVFEVVSECSEQALLEDSCNPGDCARWTSAGGCDPPRSADRPTHCRTGESEVFNCVLEAARELVVSLCASEPLDEREGYLQYRFGPPGDVEMAYPGDTAGSYQAFEYTRYTRPRTTYLRLRFQVGNHLYVIADDSTDEGSSERLVITMPDGGKTRFPCRGRAEGSLMRLEGYVPQTPWTESEM
jgi:putative hemolysin